MAFLQLDQRGMSVDTGQTKQRRDQVGVAGWSVEFTTAAREATRLKLVRPNRSTGAKRVNPPPSESQSDESDDTDRRGSGSH